ncbi:alpha/beta hydrolase [bacterium]|nr:alpha/beta hydrolase [bacterium]
MRRTTRYLLLAVAALSAADLTGGPPPRPAPPVPGAQWLGGPVPVVHRTRYPEPTPVADARPVVWVIDGAGDLKGCSNALTQANLTAGTPVELSVFNWSHGPRRLIADQIDTAHAREQGRRLAAEIKDGQARAPGRRTVIVAHSAGCAVALAAAEALPSDSIDRVILLAPSVSAAYDLRPALRAPREGIDVLCSQRDWVALGFAVRLVGTTDRSGAPAAGRFGFRADMLDDRDVPRLRQHFWSPDVAWTGHTGGHHGMHAPTFLHTYLFPMLGATVR